MLLFPLILTIVLADVKPIVLETSVILFPNLMSEVVPCTIALCNSVKFVTSVSAITDVDDNDILPIIVALSNTFFK